MSKSRADNTDAEKTKPKRRRKPSAQKLMSEGKRVSDNIYLCSDGKYRWVYEVNLFTNPTIFLLVWKILFFVILGVMAFMMLLDIFENNLSADLLLSRLRLLGYLELGMTVLAAISYLVYAAIMGGKYCAMFEMDENSITHKQMPKQAKKAELIAILTVLAGLASKNITTVGVGTSSARSEMTTEFGSVRHVRVHRRHSLIKVNQLLGKNRVYVAEADYDFVLGYILQRVPEKAKPKQFRTK